MYVVWVKIDETLPWIELRGTYETIKEARKAAMTVRDRMQTKIVNSPKKQTPMKTSPSIRVTS